jgi:hypothetical protein
MVNTLMYAGLNMFANASGVWREQPLLVAKSHSLDAFVIHAVTDCAARIIN